MLYCRYVDSVYGPQSGFVQGNITWLAGLFVTSIVIVELYDVFDDALQPSLFPFDHVANRQLPQFLKVADLPTAANRMVGPAYDTRPGYYFGIVQLRYVTKSMYSTLCNEQRQHHHFGTSAVLDPTRLDQSSPHGCVC